MAVLLLTAEPATIPAWESDARVLEISRARAEDALLRLQLGSGDVSGASRALQSFLDDAGRYETDLDGFNSSLMGPTLPAAAAERNLAYLDTHRARHRALADVQARLENGADPKAAAHDALAVLAQSGVAMRDVASAVRMRSVRRIPPRTTSAEFRELVAERLPATDVPRDLAPASPELTAFARRFGSAPPSSIADWIRRAMTPAPYHGEALGPGGALREHRGSAFDLSSLLVEILRARNVPARLAYGVLEADGGALARQFLGGGDAGEALDALALGGVPAEPARDPRRIRFEHVWVRAKIGGEWTDLDPTLDPNARPLPATRTVPATPDLDPAALLARYLADPNDRTPIGSDLLPAVAFAAGPLPKTAAALLPAVIILRAGEFASVPAAYRGSVAIAAGGSPEIPLLELRIPLHDVLETGVLFYPRPPSDLDRKILAALGASATADPANRLPPHLQQSTMVISAGGRELAALPPAAIGAVIPITTTLFPPSGDPVDVPGWLQAGAPAAISVIPFAPGRGFLASRWHEADVHPEGAVGFARMLSATGAQFFADLLDETGRLADRAGGHRFVSPSAVLVAASYHAPQGLARAPLFTDAAGLTVDVGRLDEILLPGPSSHPVAFELASGAALSSWEARALRIATAMPAVSTVIAAKASAAAGGRPRILTGRPKKSQLAGLSAAARAEIQDALGRGLSVVLPRSPQSLERWVGESYVLLDPRSGRGAYLIRGALHGAATADSAGALLVALREGADLSGTLAAWRKGRAARALLAREGWSIGALPHPALSGVEALLPTAAGREWTPLPSTRPWPPYGGHPHAVEIGAPIALSGVGAVLWMGNRTLVLDPEVAYLLGERGTLPRNYDPNTHLWTGPTALAVVPSGEQVRLLPIPARY